MKNWVNFSMFLTEQLKTIRRAPIAMLIIIVHNSIGYTNKKKSKRSKKVLEIYA